MSFRQNIISKYYRCWKFYRIKVSKFTLKSINYYLLGYWVQYFLTHIFELKKFLILSIGDGVVWFFLKQKLLWRLHVILWLKKEMASVRRSRVHNIFTIYTKNFKTLYDTIRYQRNSINFNSSLNILLNLSNFS